MMAKSRMHEELIMRAKRSQIKSNDVHGQSTKIDVNDEMRRQATPPSPPLSPPGPCPPPPPPPPPPSQPLSSNLTPDLEDSITHMASMSKSKMHAELIAKANSKCMASPETNNEKKNSENLGEIESDVDAKVLERKKIVQDILDKNEPTSSSVSRKLNEQRRRQFFESTTADVNDEDECEKAVEVKGESLECSDKIEVVPPPRQKVKNKKMNKKMNKFHHLMKLY